MPTWRFQPNPKRLNQRCTPFQSWFITRQSRNIVAVAARRSGKTVAARARILRRCLSTPNGLVGYIGPTLKQAKRLIWRALMRDLQAPEARSFLAPRGVNRSDLTIDFANGCRFCVYGAERPEQIRGDGFDELVVDEGDDPNFDDAIFNDVIGPALSDQLGTLAQLGSPKGRGRLCREWRKGQESSPDEERDATYESIQVTAAQAGIIAPSEIARAKRIRPPRSYRQEYEASFEAPVGIIYDEWDECVHVVSSIPERFEEVIAGVDWGTANRGAMLPIGIDRVVLPETEEYDECELARAWVLDEESHAGMGYDDDGWWRVARQIQQRWHPTRWYADPAGGREGYLRQLRNALAGSDGPPVEVVPADNQVGPGIAAVEALLHHDEVIGDPPRLLVHERCKWLRKEIADYRWRAHATVEDEFTDEPVKSNDHCCDGTRYAVFTHLYAPHGRAKRMGHMEARGR
jgi:hypothetical protein